MAGILSTPEAVSGANIHTGVIGELSRAGPLKAKGIVRAAEVYMWVLPNCWVTITSFSE